MLCRCFLRVVWRTKKIWRFDVFWKPLCVERMCESKCVSPSFNWAKVGLYSLVNNEDRMQKQGYYRVLVHVPYVRISIMLNCHANLLACLAKIVDQDHFMQSSIKKNQSYTLVTCIMS